MKEVGEEDTENVNLDDREIHSIKGLLKFALMLEDAYSKELMEDLMNKTYKKLFECYLFRDKTMTPFIRNINILLKEPKSYFNDIDIDVDFNEQSAVFAYLAKNKNNAIYQPNRLKLYCQ